MIGVYVVDKHQARLQQLEQSIRLFCRSNEGVFWASSRTMTGKKLFRGSTETMRLIRELAAAGHIGRVTARGRGRGKGRTLYWLPHVKKWRVLLELRREDMPAAAVAQAIAFFLRRERASSAENVTDQAQHQSLGLSTFGTESEKGAPAAPARRSRAPSDAQRQASTRVAHAGTPPPTRRLVKHGSALERLQSEQLEMALERMRAVVVDRDKTRRAELERRMAKHIAGLRGVVDPDETTPHL